MAYIFVLPLKIRRQRILHPSAAEGVRKCQPRGVQQQARGARLHAGVSVQRVAQDGVADGGQVQAQLVGAPGDGRQLEPRGR